MEKLRDNPNGPCNELLVVSKQHKLPGLELKRKDSAQEGFFFDFQDNAL